MYKLLRKIAVIVLLTAATLLSGAEKAADKVDMQLLLKARQGDAQAQLETGFAFFKLGNPVRAAYWFHAAAMQGLPAAEYNLARCYLEGFGVSKNPYKALELLEKAAGKNILQAQLALAKLCLSGAPADPDARPPQPELPRNEKRALELLKNLTEQNVPDALTMYAAYLAKQKNHDPQQVIKMLDQAAEQNDAKACMILADYLLNRHDSLRDEAHARKLLEKASAENPEAMARFAYMVENGFGAPPDLPRAFELYNKSLQQEFSLLAAVKTANYLFTGKGGVKQDIPQAIKLYSRAADAGVPEALTNLGECYRSGIGVTTDKERAFDMFFKAAQQDYPTAQYALGRAFAAGEGTQEDQKAAFFWFRQAAMRYDPRAMLETGLRYLEGRGTDPDPAQAVIFLEQAYANGMTAALIPLQRAKRLPQAPALPQAQPTPGFRLRPSPAPSNRR